MLENAILRRRSAPAFSHGADPERTDTLFTLRLDEHGRFSLGGRAVSHRCRSATLWRRVLRRQGRSYEKAEMLLAPTWIGMRNGKTEMPGPLSMGRRCAVGRHGLGTASPSPRVNSNANALTVQFARSRSKEAKQGYSSIGRAGRAVAPREAFG
jgi:hypothetical protein